MGNGVLDCMPMITVGELINTAVQQISMSFPDQDREATAEDAMLMLNLFMILVRAFVDKGDLT